MNDPLSDTDKEKITLAFAKGRAAKNEGVTAEETAKVWDECRELKIQYLLWDLVKSDQVDLDWDGKDLLFRIKP